MGLREDFERTGNWLFKKRSFIPLALLPIIVLAMFFSTDFPSSLFHLCWWKIFCVCVAFAGQIVRAFVIGQVPKGTSGRNTHGQVADVLNTKGIYSVVRHPLYIGNFLMILGVVLWAEIWWLAVIFVLLFLTYYERIMFAEEEFLRRKFGAPFEEWSARTPAFFPNFSLYQAADLEFSIKNVLKREYSGFFNMIFSFWILEAIFSYFYSKSGQIDFLWTISCLAAFALAILLRSLKKYTRLLDVEGR